MGGTGIASPMTRKAMKTTATMGNRTATTAGPTGDLEAERDMDSVDQGCFFPGSSLARAAADIALGQPA